MGDIALIQIFRKGHEEVTHFSPVCYLHSDGPSAPEYIREMAETMKNRERDVDYAFARLVGIAHTKIPGNKGLGVWNADSIQTEDDTHGDAGIYLVDCTTWEVTAMGGYGKSFNALQGVMP